MSRKKPPKTTKKTQAKSQITQTKQPNTQQEHQPQDVLADKLKNKYWVLLLVIGVGITFFVYFNFLTFKNVYLFKDIGSDELNVQYPALVAQYNTFKETDSEATWSFYFGMGRSVFKGGYYEPVGILLGTISNLIFPNDSFDVIYYTRIHKILLFKLLLSLVLSYFYFRLINTPKTISTMAAVAVGFMGYFVVASGWGHTDDVLGGMFFLVAFELFYQKKQGWLIPIATIMISSNPFYLFLFAVFFTTYVVFRFVLDKLALKTAFVNILKIVFFALIGLAVNFQSLFFNLKSMLNSPRVSGDVSTIKSAGEAAIFQIDNFPEQLTAFFRMFSSDILGNGSYYKGWYNYLEAPLFYVGILMLLLIPQFFALLTNKRKKIVHAIFFGFWILTVIVPFLRQAIHVFVGNYYKGPYDFFISFILIFYGIQGIIQIYEQKKINKPVLGATTGVMLAFTLVPFSEQVQAAKENEVVFWVVAFIIAYALVFWLFNSAKKLNLMLPVILLLFVIEITVMSKYSVENRVVYTRAEFEAYYGGYHDESWQAVQYIKGTDRSFFRMEKDFSSALTEHGSLNDAQAQGYFGTASYSSFNDMNYINFLKTVGAIDATNETQTRWAPGLRGRPLLLTWGSVKYMMTKQAPEQYTQFGYTKVGDFGSVHLMKNNYFLPLGFSYDHYIRLSEFEKLSTFQKDAMLLRAIVLEDSTMTVPLPEYTAKDTLAGFDFDVYQSLRSKLLEDTLAMTDSKFRHYKIEGTFENKQDKYLFFSIPYSENWQLLLDNHPHKLDKTNIGFIGSLIPAGKHSVRLEYIQKNNALYRWLIWMAWLVYVLYFGGEFALNYYRNKRKTKTVEEAS